MKKPFIIFITGASGVGKTTLVNNLKSKYSNNAKYQFEHFDSIEVPSVEKMNEQFGSDEKWQEAMTHQWVDKLIHDYQNKEVIIFEGQVNLKFIKESFQKNNFADYGIILVDVNEEDMASRLTHKRNQPELVTNDMKKWLLFLRNQAQELNVPIIDTTNKPLEEVVKEFELMLSGILANQ